MKYQISRLFGGLVGIPVAIGAFLTSIFTLDIMFIYDILIGSAGFIIGYIPTQRLTSRSYLKELNLTRKDYRYVTHQIQTTQGKIKRIFKTFINVRSINDFKLVNDIYRISRTVNATVRQRPDLFYNIESFYYTHIDNALNLIESYTRLAKMPVKSTEERQMLQQTRITLEEVRRNLVADLKEVNAQDYNQLDTEMKLNKIYQKRKEMEHKK